MFNFEGLIPKICLLAQEMGDDERAQSLRCAGLQTLSATVIFLMLNNYGGLVMYFYIYVHTN